MTEIYILILFVLLATYLWASVKAKEIAIRMGYQACERKGLQFLDQTVEQQSVRLGRDRRKNPCWIRKYQFEFATDGELRYEGQLILHGYRLYEVTLDPYPEDLQDTDIFYNTKL